MKRALVLASQIKGLMDTNHDAECIAAALAERGLPSTTDMTRPPTAPG